MSFISRLRRSRQHRVSILSAYLVHPFPLRGTSPQGETRALRDLLSVSYDIVSILVISRCAAPPYPAAPDFPPKGETTHYDLCVAGAPSNHVRCASTGKRVTRFSGRFAPLRIVFPCHPIRGDRINCSMLFCRDMVPWLSIHSATTKWWHQRRKRISSGEARLACFSPGESPVVRFYHKRAPSINLAAPPQPSRRRRVKLKNPQATKPQAAVNHPRSRIPIPHSPIPYT